MNNSNSFKVTSDSRDSNYFSISFDWNNIPVSFIATREELLSYYTEIKRALLDSSQILKKQIEDIESIN